MSPTSGDGFVTLADGTRRWGRFGAAGLLVRHVDGGDVAYFVALRSQWCHQGGTWAIPGGARNEDEAPIDAALREFEEEIGLALSDFDVVEVHEDDHGGWSYWTIVVDVPHRFTAPPAHHWETADARWVDADDLARLDLFDAFRATLVHLGITPTTTS